MTQLIVGDETFLRWLHPGWRRRVLGVGLLLLLLAFTVAWAVGAVFAALVLWRHGSSNPAAAVFLGGWLLLWAAFLVWVVQAIRKARRVRQSGMYVFEGFSRVGAFVF